MTHQQRRLSFTFAFLMLLAVPITSCSGGGGGSGGTGGDCTDTACNDACQTAGYPSGACSAGACTCIEPFDASIDTASFDTPSNDTSFEAGTEDTLVTDAHTPDEGIDTSAPDFGQDTVVTDPTEEVIADSEPADLVAEMADCTIDHSGITGRTDQRLVFQSVNFENDSVVLRNISNDPVSFALNGEMGQPSWRIHIDSPPNGHNLPAGFTIPPDGTVRVYLGGEGTNDAETIYLGLISGIEDITADGDGGGSELAILSPHNGYEDPAAQEAFVRWGGDEAWGDAHTFRDQAAAANVWIGDDAGDFVFVFSDTHGITVTEGGDARDPTDWTHTASDDCL